MTKQLTIQRIPALARVLNPSASSPPPPCLPPQGSLDPPGQECDHRPDLASAAAPPSHGGGCSLDAPPQCPEQLPLLQQCSCDVDSHGASFCVELSSSASSAGWWSQAHWCSPQLLLRGSVEKPRIVLWSRLSLQESF